MIRFLFKTIVLLFFPFFTLAQEIIFSDPLKEDNNRDLNFDIIGRVNNNILIFKNLTWRFSINIYNDSMELKENVPLLFMPGKTINVDYIAYPDFFYLIYQHQKKGIVYCMAAKIDANGNKIGEPIQLDTTQIGFAGDNKIYSTIRSDDKEKVMVFKIQRGDEKLNFVTLLFNKKLELLHKTRSSVAYDERNDIYSDFLLDNDGNFIFTGSLKDANRVNISSLYLMKKSAYNDEFVTRKFNLNNSFIDEVKIKIDNVNKRYIINSFYYIQRRGDIEGIFSAIWDVREDSVVANIFTPLDDSIRASAKMTGNPKIAFNDFFIRNIILKKDGSYILAAEEFTSQSSNVNNWNRNNFLFNPYNPYDYYFYNPSFGNFYRPFNNFNNQQQSFRYYYDNILILSFTKNGVPEWSNVITKQQYAEDNENHLSFNTFSTANGVHFLFNDITKRDKFLLDYIITANGVSKRNPSLRTYEKGYEFMPRFSKQIGARQIIIPCSYRNQICFAKVDF